MADTLKENLKKLTVKKLRNIISNSNIKNYSKLKKLELINLILSNKTRIAGSGTNPDFLKPKTKIKVGRKIPPKSQAKPKSKSEAKSNPFEKVDKMDFDSFQQGKISGADLANRRTWRRNNPGLAQAYKPMSDFFM